MTIVKEINAIKNHSTCSVSLHLYLGRKRNFYTVLGYVGYGYYFILIDNTFSTNNTEQFYILGNI